MGCAIRFGKWRGGDGVLQRVENTECCICLETLTCIKQAFCSHVICMEHFKRCYDPPDVFPRPVHPYWKQGQEDDEEEDDHSDPLIVKYYEDMDDYEAAMCDEYERLAKCPICRRS